MKERRTDSKSRVGIYVRVSTSGQSTRAQELELRAYGRRRGWLVHRVYADRGFSGAKESRPALDDLLADCRRRRLDVVLVWKFDRFARSLKQLVSALEEFHKLGVNFISATEGIDTTVASGELVFGIIAAMGAIRALIDRRKGASRTGSGSQRRSLPRKTSNKVPNTTRSKECQEGSGVWKVQLKRPVGEVRNVSMGDAATSRWWQGACMKRNLSIQVAPTEGNDRNRSKRGGLLKQSTPGFSYTAISRVSFRRPVRGVI